MEENYIYDESDEIEKLLESDIHSDVQYLINNIEKRIQVDWVEWFFRVMSLYVIEKRNGYYYKRKDFPTNQLLDMEREIRNLLEDGDRYDPQIIMSLLVILNKYNYEQTLFF